MAASSREEIVERFDAFRDAVCDLLELSFDVLTTPERLDLLERLEHDTSRLAVARHALINGVRQQATAAEIGGKLAHVVADRLHITRADASRRIEEAEDLPCWIDTRHPPVREGQARRAGHAVSARAAGHAGRQTGRLPEPRRELQRRRPGPPARTDPGQPRPRPACR